MNYWGPWHSCNLDQQVIILRCCDERVFKQIHWSVLMKIIYSFITFKMMEKFTLPVKLKYFGNTFRTGCVSGGGRRVFGPYYLQFQVRCLLFLLYNFCNWERYPCAEHDSEYISSGSCTKCPCGNRNRREVSLLARQVNRECLMLGNVKIISQVQTSVYSNNSLHVLRICYWLSRIPLCTLNFKII